MKILVNIFFLFFLSISINAQKDSIYIKQILDKAYNFEQTKPDSALFFYDKIIKFAHKTEFPIFEAKANNYKGIVFSDMGKYDSAVSYYNKSIVIFKDINNQKGIAANLINIGNTFQLQGEFQNATNYYLKGIAIYEELQDNFRLSISYGNLATIFDAIGQKEDAKKSFLKSNKFAEKVNDSVQLVYNYYNLTDLYLDQKLIDTASIYIKKAKNHLGSTTNNHLKYLVNYGETRCFIQKNEFAKALSASQKTLNYAKQNNNPYYLALTYLLIGKVYLKQEKYVEALNETLKGLAIAENHKNNANLIKIHSQLFSVYSKMNENKKALFHKESEYKYKDIVLNEKQKKNINAINIKYQTEKKDKEILNQKIELQQQKTTENYMIGLVVFSLLASMLSWLYFKQRQKRKNQEIISLKRKHQINTLESLMEGEEKERFRIAKELHDGVNGDLSAIKYKLSSLLDMNNIVIKEAITMIDSSCQQVRAISHNLVPPSLEKFNLIEATQDYCSNLDAIQSVHILFQYLGESLAIPKKAEVNIFRIIQELVTNSTKHAEAKEINVQISCRDKNIQLTVEDDGIGYLTDENNSKGIGLKNIKSRIDYLQATIEVVSNKQGTSTTIEIDTTKLNDN